MREIIVFLAIHLIAPLVGFLYFLYLIVQMKRENIPNPPIISLFVVFAVYGLTLLLVLTELFWYWSGMTSLGALFLIFCTPIPMAVITFRHWRRKKISKYHKWTFILGLAYFFISVCLLVIFLS